MYNLVVVTEDAPAYLKKDRFAILREGSMCMIIGEDSDVFELFYDGRTYVTFTKYVRSV